MKKGQDITLVPEKGFRGKGQIKVESLIGRPIRLRSLISQDFAFGRWPATKSGEEVEKAHGL